MENIKSFTSRIYAKASADRKLDLRFEIDTVLDKLNTKITAEIEV